MATYKAEWLVTKRQTLVFETDYPITDKVALNDKADEAYKDEGPDKEELLSSILYTVQDITPPEEHVAVSYASWYYSQGALYFRSSKTGKDYQIMHLTSAGDDNALLHAYAIVEMSKDENGKIKYSKVIEVFTCAEEDYIADYHPHYNDFIADAIRCHEQEQSSVSD